MSLFRYGLDYVQMAIQRLIGFGKKKSLRKFWHFKKADPDRIRVLVKFVVYREKPAFVVKWLSKHQKPNIKLDLFLYKEKTLNFM